MAVVRPPYGAHPGPGPQPNQGHPIPAGPVHLGHPGQPGQQPGQHPGFQGQFQAPPAPQAYGSQMQQAYQPQPYQAHARQGTGAVRSAPRSTPIYGAAGGFAMIAAGLFIAYGVSGPKGSSAATLPTALDPRPVVADAGAATALLGKPVEVKIGKNTAVKTWAELGLELDAEEAKRPTAALPLRINSEKALLALRDLKSHHDRAPTDAFLDLEGRKVVADSPGEGIDLFGSLPRLEAAARSGATAVELRAVPVPASVTIETLGIDDISHVLGTFTTKFSVADKERNFNLKLAASKINGFVMKPGQEFSFNGVVGERSEKEGYKVAHVITAGEMVDGLAGGTCQISTTLFGASFFAGLDIVKTTTHSRPSVYTPLGFDATVVWPNVDLKMSNGYEFPIAIHYRVAGGEATVEILGKKRPWDKIVFERKVLESEPYPTEERLDDTLPVGAVTLDQEGFEGYKMTRFRKFYKDGKHKKTEKWDVVYKPVTEYVRRGTSTDPNAKVPKEKPHHGPQAPKSDTFTLAQ
jgi:vancomycin resistance protein YoaR